MSDGSVIVDNEETSAENDPDFSRVLERGLTLEDAVSIDCDAPTAAESIDDHNDDDNQGAIQASNDSKDTGTNDSDSQFDNPIYVKTAMAYLQALAKFAVHHGNCKMLDSANDIEKEI